MRNRLNKHPFYQYCLTLFAVTLLILCYGKCLNAQNIGASISADNSAPNANAMLDVKSPATGDGKGMLIPRVTSAQRTTASSALAGGLLNDSGQLRGGAAQGLMVYQTDGQQGFYYNQSNTNVPSWTYIIESNTLKTPIGGTTLTIGDNAYTTSNGVSIGVSANSKSYGATVGYQSNGATTGAAIGYQATGYYNGASVGYKANARSYGVAIGKQANGYDSNVCIGYRANAYTGQGPYSGSVSIGYTANSFSGDGKYTGGVAVGYRSNARHNFNENDSGAVAVGFMANSFIRGVGVGYKAAGYNCGAAVGYHASGSNNGTAIGYRANAYSSGTALGYMANSGNKHFSIAKGPYSKCTRYNEEWKTSDGQYNKYGYGQVNFHGATTTGSATEIYLGGKSNQRFTIQSNSFVSFQILISARNQNNQNCSFWRCWGGIKRDGYNTYLVSTVTIDSKTQGTLNISPSITADDINDSLKIRVTGVNKNTVRWNAQMIYSEIRE